MHKIILIRLYFPLDAPHVSDYISPCSGATFYKLSIAFGISRYHTSGCCVAIVTQQPDRWYRHIPNAMYSVRSNFISCTTHLVYAGNIRLTIIATQQHENVQTK